MEIDFTKLPISTKVWSMNGGWGKIVSINTDRVYSIQVMFDYEYITFTSDGRQYTCSAAPTLFLNKFKIPDEAYRPPRPDLKVDDKVIVWDDESRKHHRHFKRWTEDGKIECFGGGETSWSNDRGGSSSWNYYAIPESE